MRKFLFVATLFLGVLSVQAQEKVMDILMADGTSVRTRLAELQQISFLTLDNDSQGMLVKTLGGETTPVLFETHPVVTASGGRLIVKSSSADDIEFEISDIAEIRFGDAAGGAGIRIPQGFTFVLQDDGAVLRNIPATITPRVYSIDGRLLPAPPVMGGELRLNRETLGAGTFIVKVSTFSAKIQL